MPAPVEFTITMSALSAGFNGDPQELADEIAARLTITPSEPWSSFINGGAEPTSDVGPWLRLGQEWRVWDVGLGAYTYHVQNGAGIVDGTVTGAKLTAGAVGTTNLADDSVTLAKFADGTAKGVLTFNASGVPTISAAGTNGWVLTQSASGPVMAALPAASPFAAYVGTATLNGGQAIPADVAAHKMTLDTPIINGDGAFVIASSRYVALADGKYHLDVTSQFDVGAGNAALMQISLALYKNGILATEGIGGFANAVSPTGGRWPVNFGGVIELALNDFIEVFATIDDGSGTNIVDLTTWDFSVFRVSA